MNRYKLLMLAIISLFGLGCSSEVDVKLVESCYQNPETAIKQAEFISTCVNGGTNHSLSKHYRDADEDTEHIVAACQKAAESTFRQCSTEYRWCIDKPFKEYECYGLENWMLCSKATTEEVRRSCKVAGYKYESEK